MICRTCGTSVYKDYKKLSLPSKNTRSKNGFCDYKLRTLARENGNEFLKNKKQEKQIIKIYCDSNFRENSHVLDFFL